MPSLKNLRTHLYVTKLLHKLAILLNFVLRRVLLISRVYLAHLWVFFVTVKWPLWQKVYSPVHGCYQRAPTHPVHSAPACRVFSSWMTATWSCKQAHSRELCASLTNSHILTVFSSLQRGKPACWCSQGVCSLDNVMCVLQEGQPGELLSCLKKG